MSMKKGDLCFKSPKHLKLNNFWRFSKHFSQSCSTIARNSWLWCKHFNCCMVGTHGWAYVFGCVTLTLTLTLTHAHTHTLWVSKWGVYEYGQQLWSHKLSTLSLSRFLLLSSGKRHHPSSIKGQVNVWSVKQLQRTSLKWYTSENDTLPQFVNWPGSSD